ncbi:hypothetical protein [Nannocystis punicea]|uniref:Lipoprotein n=1 Tax=Nannocystis punicea TaxID=2995304 RepID=A0ABY7HGQ1_9BACT|nr:hypothetical protein [Nannocystis poenicansa]WAS98164.1 hypothetical protein O0S08_18650 [Nannocystis poenicansa]
MMRALDGAAALSILAACPDSGSGMGPHTTTTTTEASTTTTEASTTGGEAEALTVHGVIKGRELTEPVKVVVLWWVETEEGDGLYKFGDGAVDGMDFSLTLPAPLPAGATLGGELGVGLVALVPATLELPDGLVMDDIEEQLVGAAGEELLVWRTAGPMTLIGPDWVEAFPPGYSCSDCVQAMDVGSFDSFDSLAVGPCDDLTLYVPFDAVAPFCEWS